MVVAKSKNNSSSKKTKSNVLGNDGSSSECDSNPRPRRHQKAHGLINKFIEKKQAETPPGSLAPKHSVFNYYDPIRSPRRKRKATRFTTVKRTLKKFRLLLATILLILYVAGGAAIFWQIEHRSKEHLTEHKTHILEKSKTLYVKLAPSKCSKLLATDTVESNVCLKEIYEVLFELDPPSKTIETFMDGMSYVLTSITTIGYGNLICYTVAGKLVTVVYGIVGITFLIYVLRNNGKMMLWFCNMVLKIGSQFCGCCQPEAPRMTVTKGLTLLFVFWSLGTLGVALFEEFPFWDAIYFSFVTFSTVGYGDLVPTGHVSTAIILTLHFIDLSLISMVVALVHESMENNFMQVLEILDEGYRKKTMGLSPAASNLLLNDMNTSTAREKTPILSNKN